MNTGTGWAGLEKWHYKAATHLQDRGYNIFVIARHDTQFKRECEKAGFEVAATSRIETTTFINPKRLLWLVKYLKNNNINAIFAGQSSHYKYGSLAGKLAGVEKIVYRRAIAKAINNRFYNRWLLKNCVTDFMSISKNTMKSNLSQLPDDVVEDEKIKLIYNGVDPEIYIDSSIETNIREEFDISSDEMVVANIGRLSRQKAQQYLIEALPKILDFHEDIKILFVGKGGKREKYKEKSKELGIEDKVIFTGYREDVPSILKQIDFLVHTAVYEGCPWIILEAMMTGVPIVSTRAMTVQEFVKDGETGYIAEDRNPEDIAEKVIKMIKNENRERMGEKAAEIAEEKYTTQKMIDDIENKILLNR